MQAKYKIYLRDNLYAVLRLSLEIPAAQRDIAEAQGIGKEEQANLVGQKMAELLQLMGSTDEEG